MFSHEGLVAFLREQQKRPHTFGQNDCGTLLMDWMQATLGVDPCPDWRGAYASHDEAVNRSGRLGLAVQVWRLAKRAGCCLAQNASDAQLGDLGMFTAESRPGRAMFGIFCGDGWATRDCGISRYWMARSLIVWVHPLNQLQRKAMPCCGP